MDWKKERDALIAQTMAFVQSVSSKTEATAKSSTVGSGTVLPQPEAARALVDRPEVRPGPASIEKPAAAGPAEPERSAPLSLPIPQTDMKREIQDRIASFRAHQERFNRERAEYFNATLAKLRTTAGEKPASPRGE
jgi:hypothetical protein